MLSSCAGTSTAIRERGVASGAGGCARRVRTVAATTSTSSMAMGMPSRPEKTPSNQETGASTHSGTWAWPFPQRVPRNPSAPKTDPQRQDFAGATDASNVSSLICGKK